MKKTVVLLLSAATLLSSCGTYTGSGAFAGASLGSVLGSAVGGIAGGPRGSDIGTLVGMAGGAVVGGAIGAQADKANAEAQASYDADFERRYERHRSEATRNSRVQGYADDSGYDPEGRGDDVLYDFQGSDYTGDYTATHPEHVDADRLHGSVENIAQPSGNVLEVRNARFVDDNQDKMLSGNELSKVIFEVYNVSQSAVFDVQPMVVETTGNKRIFVSNTIHVESIMPGRGIRYTAMVKGGSKLKDGTALFRVYAVRGDGELVSNVCEFEIPTSRR